MSSGEPMVKKKKYRVKCNLKWEKNYLLDKLMTVPTHVTVYYVKHGCVAVKSGRNQRTLSWSNS